MKNIFSTIVSFIIILTFTSTFYSQDSWKYPTRPGTKEWEKLKSKEEVIQAQQIPENILKKMTTEQVFKAWLDLPGRVEILAFNTLQKGFDVTRSRYNVVDELLSRKNAGNIILDYYYLLSPLKLSSKENVISKGRFITNFAFVELLLAQPEILDVLSQDQRRSLFYKNKGNLERKNSFSRKEKDFFWLNSGLVLAGRIIEKENSMLAEKVQLKQKLSKALKRADIFTKSEFEELSNKIRSYNF